MSQLSEEQRLASGVDELVARLREEGVTAGLNEGKTILADARHEAKHILEKANADARQRLEAASKEAEAFRAAGIAALKTAMRDMVLDMKATLTEGFSADVKRLVSHQLQDPQVLKQMILELAARARDDIDMGKVGSVEFILPETVIGLEELRSNPEALQEGPLTEFVFGLTREMLQEGITFAISGDMPRGIRVQLNDTNVVIDLTEQTVAQLLLQHLQPRFRAILEGVVK